MANKPVIIIGIGTSGLYTLEHVQNFYYENTGKNKPAWVEYLYIETNKDNQPGITALKNEIKRVYMSLADMKIMIRQLKEEREASLAHLSDDGLENQMRYMNWLPPEEHILDAGLGAGGIPSCGRLALWGRNREGNNFRNVINSIEHAYQTAGGTNVEGSDGTEPAVFITGSLTGGTGTGIFLDLAYLVRRIIPTVKELFGLFLLPPQPTAAMRGNEIVYANSLGALRAMKHYNTPEHKFVIPDEEKEYSEPPFELTQFISQSYNGSTPPLSSLQGLYKMAGLYLFLNIAGLRAKRLERLVDAKGNQQIGKYGTYGLSAIQYPKAQIQEYLSLELGISLLEKWVDTTSYYQGNQRISINNAQISKDVTDTFGKILRKAFDDVNSAGGGINLYRDIEKDAGAINRNEKGDKRDALNRLFSNAYTDGYYSFVSNNIQAGMDTLIQSVSDWVTNDFNRYESLYHTRRQLEVLCDVIDDILRYWQSLGISSFVNNWDKLLASQITWMLEGNKVQYGVLGEKTNVLKDRMFTTLDMLKMHLFVNKLIDIRENIRKGETPLTTANISNAIELPIIPKIDGMIKEIQLAIGSRDNDGGSQKKFKNLRKRKSEIEADMNDDTMPILRIFPSGSFDSEASQSLSRYYNIKNVTFPTKDALIGSQGKLWDYLTDNKKINLRVDLYHDCILKFKEDLIDADAVKDYDVSKYVNQNPKTATKIAQKAISYLLPIRDKTLDSSQNIPKVVIGADKTVIQNVIQLLKSENFHEFGDKGDHILEVQELKNIMVFYIEQGNYEPLDDISYIEDVEKLDVNYPKRLSNMDTKKWANFRNPYIQYEDYQAYIDKVNKK
jgi:hypothetical protein